LSAVLKWASLLAAVVALWLSYGKIGAPYITNDGYQYLDAASNLASGKCFCTRVALFDEQVELGRIPIPFTHFAPGYPLLMAAVSRLGVSIEIAGYLLSAFGFLVVLWMMWDIALGLGAQPWVVAAFSLLWITHATGLLYASTVGTESLFAALLLGVAALVVRDVLANKKNSVLPVLIGVCAGLSYGIRYPGLFIVAAAGVYLLVRAWRTSQARLGAVAGIVSEIVIVGCIQIRNLIYTGSWRGGFQNSGRHTLPASLAETIRSFLHLMTGDRVPLHFNVWFAIFALSTGWVLFLLARSWTRRDFEAKGAIIEAIGWICFIGVVYSGGILLATLTTIAGDLPRYYFPVYPLFLTCALIACSSIAKGGLNWLPVATLIISLIAIEGRSVLVAPSEPDWILTRAVLSEKIPSGIPLLQWLQQRVSPNDVVIAVEGQALHYISQRPVVAVIPPQDSHRRTDEEGYKSLMHQYHSRYLVLFPNTPSTMTPEQYATVFLRDLASGTSPAWLKLVERTTHAAIYECGDCTQ
jgi:hypothetical protein